MTENRRHAKRPLSSDDEDEEPQTSRPRLDQSSRPQSSTTAPTTPVAVMRPIATSQQTLFKMPATATRPNATSERRVSATAALAVRNAATTQNKLFTLPTPTVQSTATRQQRPSVSSIAAADHRDSIDSISVDTAANQNEKQRKGSIMKHKLFVNCRSDTQRERRRYLQIIASNWPDRNYPRWMTSRYMPKLPLTGDPADCSTTLLRAASELSSVTLNNNKRARRLQREAVRLRKDSDTDAKLTPKDMFRALMLCREEDAQNDRSRGPSLGDDTHAQASPSTQAETETAASDQARIRHSHGKSELAAAGYTKKRIKEAQDDQESSTDTYDQTLVAELEETFARDAGSGSSSDGRTSRKHEKSAATTEPNTPDAFSRRAQERAIRRVRSIEEFAESSPLPSTPQPYTPSSTNSRPSSKSSYSMSDYLEE